MPMKDQIQDPADLEWTIREFVELKNSGSSLVGDCPKCGGKNKFSFHPAKCLFKCFACDIGGKSPLSFLTKSKGFSVQDAKEHFARRDGTHLEPQTKTTKLTPEKTFRDLQLEQSGIPESLQIAEMSNGLPQNRYENGGIGKNGSIRPGGDMVLNYLDLAGNPSTFTDPDTGEARPFNRVRFSNPENHLDRDSKPMKYWQPRGSGCHLWIPETIRRSHQKKAALDTLYITEGEKKADKMCAHDLAAIGIAGIQNLVGDAKMTETFKSVIGACAVRRVVFVLDADWNDISRNPEKPIDARPRSFFSAVQKFGEYFRQFSTDGDGLGIFFAYPNKQEHSEKGIDDLLAGPLNGRENLLAEDFKNAFLHGGATGRHINCHEITSMSDLDLMKFWHLHDEAEFMAHHADSIRSFGDFKFAGNQWKVNEIGSKKGTLLKSEEEFWEFEESQTKSGKSRTSLHFRYQGMRVFLRNRGFGKFRMKNGKVRFFQKDKKILREVDQNQICDFVVGFVENANLEAVLELILRGRKHYLGAENLHNMYELEGKFLEAKPRSQIFIFENVCWEITADAVTEKKFDSLEDLVWESQVTKFSPTKLGPPLVRVKREEHGFVLSESPEIERCVFAQFLKKTGNFWWRDFYREETMPDGRKKWVEKREQTFSAEQKRQFDSHFVSKMAALGYLIYHHHNPSEARAIVAMDGQVSKLGTSEGGTGKSLFGKALDQLVRVVRIDAKRNKLSDDAFLLEQVDERTRAIVFDDCLANFDFEFLFSKITQGITVNPKGQSRFSLDPPKFLLTTNHALRGEGNSFERRQYIIAFSDWYNGNRSPAEEFGGNFFESWEDAQWNLFYRFMACCLQTYLKFGFKYAIPTWDVAKRKLRQSLGENFIDWASTFFNKDEMRNKRVGKESALRDFLDKFPSEKARCNVRHFKQQVKDYCAYEGLIFNPNSPTGIGGDIKSSGTEYFIVADEGFDASALEIAP